MNIDISEVMRLHGRLCDINTDMNNILLGIKGELLRISNNIRTIVLLESNSNLKEKITGLSENLTKDMTNLADFIKKQMDSYTVTNEEAKTALEGLVNLISEKFDATGSVIITASATITNESANPNSTVEILDSDVPMANSTRRADSTIADDTGYALGENLQSTFSGKIGNSEEKWQIVDETYYFFKDKGLSDEQIAGIIGNMTQESALDLHCPTGQYEGLFQWGKDRQPSEWDLNSQLEHAWTEIESTRSNGKVLSNLSATTTVNEATESFAKWFEGYTGEMPQRQNYANAVYYYIKNNL